MQIFKPDWQLSEAACSRIRSYGVQPHWTVLEYGPGYSTYVIQESIKPNRHICIDEPGEWGKKFSTLVGALPIDYEVRPLCDYFRLPEEQFDLILVDGPAAIGSRVVAYDAIMSASRLDSIIIIDDTHRKEENELAHRLFNSGSWSLVVVADENFKRLTTFLEPKNEIH